MTCIDSAIDFSVLGVNFEDKPIIVGGLAMEYYGLRLRSMSKNIPSLKQKSNAQERSFSRKGKPVFAPLQDVEPLLRISWTGNAAGANAI